MIHSVDQPLTVFPLNQVVLVLNANYAPLAICSAKRAICLYYLDKVVVIESYQDVIHSPSTTLAVPSVVRLKEYLRYNRLDVILSRHNILLRDNNTCQYCGHKSKIITIDHVMPRERGGDDLWENLVTACQPCNQRKGNRTPEEAGMRLLKSPKRPNWIHYFHHFVKEHQSDWRPYLFMESF